MRTERLIPDDDVRKCDCAGCGIILIGRSMIGLAFRMEEHEEYVAGRVFDRPWCKRCIRWVVPNKAKRDRITGAVESCEPVEDA